MLANMKEISAILQNCKTIAVVGLSPKENRPSNQVARYLQDVGYRIIPVNPGQTEILGETCYPSLLDIPEPVDVVDIFRRSEEVLPVVEQAVAIKAKAVWMQQGIINEEAALLARSHGLAVVMDRCLKIDHASLL
ncbi:MAG: CoA-binding protein [Deltaproteobacteria bacterium]|nr:CoA-binding protein [Deltaproteobacteria bacterium]